MKGTTGQVFIRDFGDAPDRSGRRLLMVCGLIAVPAETPLAGEHQYTVTGTVDALTLAIYPESAIDLTEEARGMLPNNLLAAPIWRV